MPFYCNPCFILLCHMERIKYCSTVVLICIDVNIDDPGQKKWLGPGWLGCAPVGPDTRLATSRLESHPWPGVRYRNLNSQPHVEFLNCLIITFGKPLHAFPLKYNTFLRRLLLYCTLNKSHTVAVLKSIRSMLKLRSSSLLPCA